MASWGMPFAVGWPWSSAYSPLTTDVHLRPGHVGHAPLLERIVSRAYRPNRIPLTPGSQVLENCEIAGG
jgi:hypothetical protein